MGTGHVMRCLSLQQAWKQVGGGEVVFACQQLPDGIRDRLGREGVPVWSIHSRAGSQSDAGETAMLAEMLQSAWIVIDGYHFGSAYVQTLRAAGIQVAAIDDFGEIQQADLILNQNLYAGPADYSLPDQPTTLLLLGPRYALMRTEFSVRSGWRRSVSGQARKILVSCGGSDHAQAIPRILEALAEIGRTDLEVVAIAGAANPRLADLQKLCGQLPYSVRLEPASERMADWMAWADLGIAAAGTTCWEMAFMGLPTLAIVTAENQVRVAESIQMQGLGINLGWIDQVSSSRLSEICESVLRSRSRRTAMSRRGHELFDGQGAARLAGLLRSRCLHLRPATSADCTLLWQWRNDPLVRQSSFTMQEISLETHSAWFHQQMASPDSLILIAQERDGTPIGQARFRFQGLRATISISVSSSVRAAGYGTALIRQATELVLGSQRAVAIDAFIKPENSASQRAFQKAGYLLTDATPGQQGLHWCAGLTGIQSESLSENPLKQSA
jgi:UDP-2,4-diacetamido-2,4,6-trideoxy-beta-L-altropyranose hydrolase